MIAPDLRPLARPIASLREDPQNARTHDKRNLAAIAASLSEFGQRKPVVALVDGTVIAGNGTHAAAKLGYLLALIAQLDESGWENASLRAAVATVKEEAEMAGLDSESDPR